jgi:hypothetical protein
VSGVHAGAGAIETFGGLFTSAADTGKGVHGEGVTTGAITNYGGTFLARGQTGRGCYGESNTTGAYTNYGGYFTAAGDTGIGVYGVASATTTVNYGGYFVAGGDTGIGVRGDSLTTGAVLNRGVQGVASGDSGRGVQGQANGTNGTGSAFGVFGETNSTSSTSAGVRGDGTGANSHDFLALNGEYDTVSMKSIKVGKQDVNIPDMIREYDNFNIQKYSYKYSDKYRDLITPYADEFQEAFELTESIDNENLNVSCVAGVAFGGVVQLVAELDTLKERVKQLEGV